MRLLLSLCLILGVGLFRTALAQVIISELMIDPSPRVELPDAEFIELQNTSATDVQLQGWSLVIGTSKKVLPSYILPAGEFIILTDKEYSGKFDQYGPTLYISSFPALSNDGSAIQLRNPQNTCIHALKYSTNWYGNEIKKQGGWSLEIIDNQNYCETTSANYTASIAPEGGTPGRKNSVFGKSITPIELQIDAVWFENDTQVCVQFNKPLDSAQLCNIENYRILERNINPQTVAIGSAPYTKVNLGFLQTFTRNRIEHLQVRLTNCAEAAPIQLISKLAIPDSATLGDVVINEVLFDASSSGAEFIELYNNSHKVLDLRMLAVSTQIDSMGNAQQAERFSEIGQLFFPDEYIAFSRDTTALHNSYPATSIGKLKTMNLPILNNEKGSIALITPEGSILERCKYSAKMQYPLLSNSKGVSLERINAASSSLDSNNWHSAAQTYGFATPGCKNSQQQSQIDTNQRVRIIPQCFSPDNDGIDDYAQIQFSLPSSGFVTNIKIYDLDGYLVRTLANNTLLATANDAITWDACNDNHQILPNAAYICVISLFHTNGTQYAYKLPWYVAKKE